MLQFRKEEIYVKFKLESKIKIRILLLLTSTPDFLARAQIVKLLFKTPLAKAMS